jgi:hypothetical protein
MSKMVACSTLVFVSVAFGDLQGALAATCWTGNGPDKKYVPCDSKEFLTSKNQHTDACIRMPPGTRVEVAPKVYRTCR